MANPRNVMYAIAFCLVVLTFIHLHVCAEIGISTGGVNGKGHEEDAKVAAKNDVKIHSENEIERRRKGNGGKGDGCVLMAPFNGEFMWCCVYGDPNEQLCYDSRTECRAECS